MLVDEEVQTCFRTRKENEARIIREGAIRWKEQLEYARQKKLQEQKQVRDMLEKCWPWGQEQNKPRGLRNLRLEGLFPNQDYQKAKRLVGSLELGRPGGGAPNINEHGYRMPRTREDPQLRFQWNGDLRRCVDNTIRYRTNRAEQLQYKNDLDKMVAEKNRQMARDKHRDDLQEKYNGWSNPETLDKLQREKVAEEAKLKRGYDKFVRTTLKPPNQIQCNDRILYGNVTTNNKDNGNPVGILKKPGQLAPLPVTGDHGAVSKASAVGTGGKENGVELVSIMAARRTEAKRPLASTDVTREKCEITHYNNNSKWKLQGDVYLHDLGVQMNCKLQQLKNVRELDIKSANHHFSTWDGFWGRPGHGAPREELKKRCLDQLLYPKIQTPVGVA